MAVLVAGVGYLGARLVADHLAAGDEAVGLENFFSTDRRAIRMLVRAGLRLVEGSITNPAAVRRAFRAGGPIETVYLLAAQASADPKAALPSYTERTNLLGPRLVLDAAAEHGASAIVFASSCKIYGEDLPAVVSEETPYGAIGDLSHLSKCYVEQLLQMYAWRQGLAARAVRLGIVYGVGPVMKRDYRFMTAPNKFCLQAVLGEPLAVSQSGRRLAGFIHLADAARALTLAARHARRGGYAALNAAPEIATVLEVAELVREAAGRRGLAVAIDGQAQTGPAAGSLRYPSGLDELGFGPSRTLPEGVEEALEYFGGSEGKPCESP